MSTVTRVSFSKTIPNRIVENSPNSLLTKSTGEFIDADLEENFLRDTWQDYKKGPQYALLVGGLVLVAFMAIDLLGFTSFQEFSILFILRLVMGLFLVGSALHIRRAQTYFKGFHRLCLWNQLAVALVLIMLGTLKTLPFIHNAFHLFMVTLIYYQFLHNRFTYTLMASAFFCMAYGAANAGLYHLQPIDMVRFILYLGLANGLGIPMLHSLNHTRRKAYIQQLKETHANQQLSATVDQLRQAQKEVKTLEGLLPICAQCKQIRDDNGYWNQIETYLHQHSRLKFSHSICPACARDLYPNLRAHLKKT